MQCMSEFIAITRHINHLFSFWVSLVDSDTDSLLSRNAAVRMGLVTRDRMDNVTNLTFGEVGHVPVRCDPVKVVLADDAQPYRPTTYPSSLLSTPKT